MWFHAITVRHIAFFSSAVLGIDPGDSILTEHLLHTDQGIIHALLYYRPQDTNLSRTRKCIISGSLTQHCCTALLICDKESYQFRFHMALISVKIIHWVYQCMRNEETGNYFRPMVQYNKYSHVLMSIDTTLREALQRHITSELTFLIHGFTWHSFPLKQSIGCTSVWGTKKQGITSGQWYNITNTAMCWWVSIQHYGRRCRDISQVNLHFSYMV